MNKKQSRVQTLSYMAMFSALAYILAFIEFPVPLSPPFARFDLSDFPALMASFMFSPMMGVGIELVKNGLQLLTSSTGGIGELANFLMGASFVYSAGMIYKHTRKSILACVCSSIIMGIVAAFANYFILLPMFEMFMPLDAIIEAFGSFLPFIQTKFDVCVFNALPFNLLKGFIMSVFTLYIYKQVKFLHKS